MLLPIARDEQEGAASPFDGLSNGIDAKTANIDVENGEIKLTHHGIRASVINSTGLGDDPMAKFLRHVRYHHSDERFVFYKEDGGGPHL
jgi:hypothetical protein